MFGHKNGARTLAQPTENSKRSLSKGRKGTKSSQAKLRDEIARFKARKGVVERGPKGKGYDHEMATITNRISRLENNLNFAS